MMQTVRVVKKLRFCPFAHAADCLVKKKATLICFGLGPLLGIHNNSVGEDEKWESINGLQLIFVSAKYLFGIKNMQHFINFCFCLAALIKLLKGKFFPCFSLPCVSNSAHCVPHLDTFSMRIAIVEFLLFKNLVPSRFRPIRCNLIAFAVVTDSATAKY